MRGMLKEALIPNRREAPYRGTALYWGSGASATLTNREIRPRQPGAGRLRAGR